MKKILAILLALAMLLGFAACGGNTEDETTTTTTAAEEVTDEAPVEESTEAASDDVSAEEPSAEDPSSAEESTAEESTEAAIKAPETSAEILALYNKTINDAYAAKVGFNKERYTDNETLNAGFLLKTFGDLIYSFMGIGAENKYTMDVTKGQWESDVPHHYLRKSTLTEADLTGAKCTENNGKYTIVLNVKPGTSKASKSESWTKAPIDKCGMCVGDLDKSYFDHKTAPVIYAAVGQVVKGAVIEESYKNAVVKAEIDAATGHLISLSVEFDISVVIDAAGGGNATGSTHVFYKNFKY
ncbi:MAG: hypothetical protein U0M02_00815 [Acutalibacteraceae bacterium]|nr:hypothetical protein [Acutalibacteraceae bacterium]